DPEASTGAAAVIRRGETELVPEIPEKLLRAAARDELHFSLLMELGLSSYMCVPLKGRDGVLGAITFVASDAGRRFGVDDLKLAEELARRATMAIGDGVLLVDRTGRVRLWNDAAARITGLAEHDVLGRRLNEVVPGWPASE